MLLEDGKGKGTKAAVTDENELCTFSIIESEDRHLNIKHDQVWSLPFEGVDPVGADDYFLYIKNTGTKNLAITDIRISSTVAGIVDVKHVSGTPSYVSETAITPVNRHLGQSKTPTATINTDTNITNLTDEGILFFVDMPTVNQLEHLRTTSNIVIPTGQAVALMWSAATGILQGIVSLVELLDTP